MQDYSRVKLTDLVKDAILKLDNTTQVIASNFSGSLFPTNNLSVGMTFYNTDNNGFYICTALSDDDNATWAKIGNADIKPGMDDKGQSISATYTSKAETKKLTEEMAALKKELTELIAEAKKAAYPRVGDIICTKNTKNPSAQYPGTTWSLLAADTFLMSATTPSTVNKTGGSNTHTITAAQMPSHTHSASCGGAGGHNHNRGNMNITGFVGAMGSVGDNIGIWDANGNRNVWGAFYAGGTIRVGSKDGRQTSSVYFDASRSWSGNTSWCNDHTHSVSIGKTGSGSSYDSRPKYLSVYMWIRIS